MVAAMDTCGTPSSVHAEGRAVRAIVERAREEVRNAVGFSVADEIEKLDRLKRSGAITEDEFGHLRARLIG